MTPSNRPRPLVAVGMSSLNRGPAHSFLELLKTQAGHREVTLVAPVGFLLDRARQAGLNVIELDGDGRATPSWQPLRAARQISEAVVELARGGAPPVIVANSVGAALRAAPAARGSRVPLYVLVRSEYLAATDVLRYRSLVAFAPDVRFLAVSPYTQGLLYGSHATGRRAVRLLPNIVPEGFYEGHGAPPAGGGSLASEAQRLVLLFIGSASRRKGFDVLLSVLEDAPDLHDRLAVVCAGPGPDLPPETSARVERLRATMPVTLLGRVDDVRPYLREADVAFLPSPLESFGRPVVEAAAMGVPVVCARNPGHMGLLPEPIGVLMFDVDRTDQAVRALRESLLRPAEAVERSELARRLAVAFSPTNVGRLATEYFDEGPLGRNVYRVPRR